MKRASHEDASVVFFLRAGCKVQHSRGPGKEAGREAGRQEVVALMVITCMSYINHDIGIHDAGHVGRRAAASLPFYHAYMDNECAPDSCNSVYDV